MSGTDRLLADGDDRADFRYQFDWFTWHIPHWTRLFADWAGRAPLRCVEIGSWEGRSAVWLLENLLDAEGSVLHCIDPWDCPIGEAVERRFDHNTALARSRGTLVKHRRSSTEVLPELAAGSFDLIYVDGAHAAPDVLTDLVLSWRLLAVGGRMICDDYPLETGIAFDGGEVSFPPVPPLERPKPAIDAFLECFAGRYRLLHKEWQVWLEKVA